MFQRIHSTQEKKPEAKDEKVREEAELEEGLRSIQPAGNEAANVELMDKNLKEANKDNIIGHNDSLNIVNQNGFRNDKNKKIRYFDISTNLDDYEKYDHDEIDDGSEIINEVDPNNSISINPKKKPSKDDEKKALNMAEKIVQGQAPKNEYNFAPLSTYAPQFLTRIGIW